MHCSKCGHKTTGINAKYCQYCGASLMGFFNSGNKCPLCGAEGELGPYCSKCGASIDLQSESFTDNHGPARKKNKGKTILCLSLSLTLLIVIIAFFGALQGKWLFPNSRHSVLSDKSKMTDYQDKSALYLTDNEPIIHDKTENTDLTNLDKNGTGKGSQDKISADSDPKLSNSDTSCQEDQDDILLEDVDTLTGWANSDRLSSLRYDDAVQVFDDLIQTYGKGKAKTEGTYKIEAEHSSWQLEDGFSSSNIRTIHGFTVEDQSDLGVLYAAADDYDGDGTADIISFRTEEVTDENDGSWIRWCGQFDKCGQNSSSYLFNDSMNDESETFFIVVGHYLIKVSNNYEGGDVWPVSEKEVEDYDMTFCETIEVQDLNDIYNIVFCSKREVSNYLPEDYDYQLDIPGETYFWNIDYSTSEDVSLHGINDESEMLTIIEEKLEELVGEPVLSLSPLRWENRWSSLVFTKPSSVLQIRMSVGAADIEETDDGNNLVGTGSFTINAKAPNVSDK